MNAQELMETQLLDLPFKVDVLDVADLGVDERYQRPLSEVKLAALGLRYDMGQAGAIDVNQRPDGSYWIMDGQHRAEKAKRDGETCVLCHVRQFTNWEDEAAFFVAKFRTATKPSPVHAYRARLGSGDPILAGVDAILSKHGFHINYTGNASDTLGLQCVSELEKIYRRIPKSGKGGRRIPGPQRLDRVLGLTRRIWGDRAGLGDAVILAAIDALCWRYGASLDEGIFAARLGHTDPKKIKKESIERAKSAGMSAITSLAVRMVEIYNLNLKKNRLPPYFMATEDILSFG